MSYQADANRLFYATAAKGFRIGGNNESLAGNASCAADLASVGVKDVPLSYRSDTVWSYELGSKLRLLQGLASLASSLFVIDWSDIQGGARPGLSARRLPPRRCLPTLGLGGHRVR